MFLRNITLALLCTLLSLSATSTEVSPPSLLPDYPLMLIQPQIIPRHLDLVPRQTSSSMAASTSSSDTSSPTGAGSAGSENGQNGGGAGGVNGAAVTVGATATSTTSVAFAGCRPTGNARLWVAGVGAAGVVGYAGIM